MSTSTDLPREEPSPQKSGDIDGKFSIDDLIDALNAAQPDDATKLKLAFAKAFPALKAAAERHVDQKRLIELFNKSGHKAHHKTFAKLWANEVARRNTNGEIVCCDACGTPLHPAQEGAARDADSLGESDGIVAEGVTSDLRI